MASRLEALHRFSCFGGSVTKMHKPSGKGMGCSSAFLLHHLRGIEQWPKAVVADDQLWDRLRAHILK